MTRKCKKGSYMALFTLVVIAAVIVLNLIVGKLPAKYLKHDLSSNQILTLGDTTRNILAQLDRDVTIHIVADPNSVDERITFPRIFRWKPMTLCFTRMYLLPWTQSPAI